MARYLSDFGIVQTIGPVQTKPVMTTSMFSPLQTLAPPPPPPAATKDALFKQATAPSAASIAAAQAQLKITLPGHGAPAPVAQSAGLHPVYAVDGTGASPPLNHSTATIDQIAAALEAFGWKVRAFTGANVDGNAVKAALLELETGLNYDVNNPTSEGQVIDLLLNRSPRIQSYLDNRDAQKNSDAAQQQQLSDLMRQQAQAEADARAAGAGAEGFADTGSSFMDTYGQWLWIGGAGIAVVMIVGGLMMKTKPKQMSGYGRWKKRR